MSIKTLFPNTSPSLLLDFANVKALDSRVSFVRTTTAAYYDGKTVAKAEENLLIRSQEFDNASWVGTALSVTSGVTAPDATSTAFTLDEGTAFGVHSLHQVPSLLSSTTYTFSCFIKNVDAGFAGLAINTTSAANYGTVEFDLSGSGSVNRTAVSGTGFSIVASSITAVGNSWFRCVATITLGSASVSDARATIYPSDGSGSFDARGRPSYTGESKTIEAWGAQLEQRSAVTAYTPTTTQAITNYIPVLLTAASGVARFDHNPTTGESLGLLIEEQRTNLLVRSEEFDNASWSIIGTVTVPTNQVIAPDGTLTADKFVLGDTIASNNAAVFQSATKPATSAPYTTSLYVKAGEFNSLRLILRDAASASNFVQAFFNLATGTIAQAANAGGTFTAASAAITAVGNGWYRVSVTGTSSTETSISVRILNYQNGTGIATGDGFSGIFIWGAQLEAGAFPTSYIPTVAATVTRNADAASMTGTNFSSWFGGAPQGTVYAEASSFGIVGTAADDRRHFWSLNQDASLNTNVVNAYLLSNGGGAVARSNADTTSTLPSIGTATNGLNIKYALAYDGQNILRNMNGTAASQARLLTSGNFNQLAFGSSSGGSSPIRLLNGTLKKLAFYPKALTAAELQAVTAS
jgi:hypothetical protein